MLDAPAFNSKPTKRQLNHTLGRFRKVCETCVSATNAGARLGPRRRRGRAEGGWCTWCCASTFSPPIALISNAGSLQGVWPITALRSRSAKLQRRCSSSKEVVIALLRDAKLKSMSKSFTNMLNKGPHLVYKLVSIQPFKICNSSAIVPLRCSLMRLED